MQILEGSHTGCLHTCNSGYMTSTKMEGKVREERTNSVGGLWERDTGKKVISCCSRWLCCGASEVCLLWDFRTRPTLIKTGTTVARQS